ncbi:MAG: heparinase II/III family protein [Mariniphaga sp.]
MRIIVAIPKSKLFCLFAVVLVLTTSVKASMQEKGIYALENPVTISWLKTHLNKQSPKLILTPEIERQLKQKLKSDPLVQNFYNYLQKGATAILAKPLLKRELEGFRLLAVSREMLERMGILCMVYRLDKNAMTLKRIDEEVKNICSFQDWNPQHFLDIAEMSFAVALAVDWVGESLPKGTVTIAKTALIEKGIKPSFNEGGERMGWINGTNNWNSVCHGGMVAASIVIADINPELAAKTISRALKMLPNSLQEYSPDGIYPEGPTYWGYGTSYAIVAANSLFTALGSDFGITKSPGFMESANFRLYATAPSGNLFNFADSGDRNDGDGAVISTWFAAKTGDALYFNRSFFENPTDAGRLAGPGLVWLSQYKEQKHSELPLNWHGNGLNPIAIFRGGKEDPGQLYLAAKGGKANISHGNMDAGTFVFELNGVRWAVDPGNQNYYLLNRIGFKLSDQSQKGERWTLLTKKNQGHSTITVNDARFLVNSTATIIDFKTSPTPEVTIDMTSLYGKNLKSLNRRFVKESNKSVLIQDRFEISDSTKNITWGMMTLADVNRDAQGAVLKQDGKTLKLTILEPSGIKVSVISLDPPPMEIDKTIKGLKRIEIRLPAYLVKNKVGAIKVRLSGD